MTKTLLGSACLITLALTVALVAPAFFGIGDAAEAIPPDTTFKCYTGTVKVDRDCDGSFEVADNEDFDSYSECKDWETTTNAYYQSKGYCTEIEEGSCDNKCVAEEDPADS